MFGKTTFILLLLITLLVSLSPAQILGTRYVWMDSIYTTTVAKDSFFTYRWENLTFYTDTIDIYFRVADADTDSWDSRDWLLLEQGDVFSFGPSAPVRRLEWKAKAGVGWLYLIGIKREEQY